MTASFFHGIDYSINNQNPNAGTAGFTPANNLNNISPISAKQALTKNTEPSLLINYQKLAQQGKISTIMFRKNITKRLLTTLTTHKHPNALLIGDAGVGKTAIVEDLAVKLFKQDPITIAMLNPKTKIYELPLNNLVAGSSLVGAMEAKLQKVIDFATNSKNHVILYIDEIHQLITNQELKNVAEILKPALARDDLHVIGSTTTQELKFWQQNPALTRRFSNIIVDELTDEQTKQILGHVLPHLQNKSNPVQVNNKLFDQVIKTGNQYAKSLNTHRPDSAITILDQALATAKLQSIELKQTAQTNIKPTLTKRVIKQAGRILVNNDQQQINTQTVKDLQKDFDQTIIGQDNAKQKIIQAVKSMALNLTPQTRPHSFLLAGLTGTGKTEIAKQTAKVLFGSVDRFIYLNMTEYSHNDSLNRLIGSPRGYAGSNSAQPLPLDTLKSNPFQIVLLDEFEKASRDVQQVFMQALDEGDIQYNDGSHVDFSHAIIIATTNAGTSHFSEHHVGFDPEQEISEADLNQALSNDFPPELLNRFEYVIGFTPISKSQYQKILVLKYQQLRSSILENHPEYEIKPEHAKTDNKFIEKLTEQSYDPLKNARPAERTIRHFIENYLEKHPNKYRINFNK